jgi:hypothetical protein
MDFKLTVELPLDTENRLLAESGDLPQAVREGFLVNLFRRGILSHFELGQALGLDPLQADDLLRRHTVAEQALTHQQDPAALGGAVRPERARFPSRSFTVGPESEDQLLQETLIAWRSLGPAAAWQAMFDMLRWWFKARGLDPEAQRVARARIEVHRVPWHGSGAERGDDA